MRFDKRPSKRLPRVKRRDIDSLIFQECLSLSEMKQKIKEDKSYVNEYDIFDYTPLHYACLNYSVDIALFLIENEANVHLKNNNGLTPLHMLVLSKRPYKTGIIEKLIQKGGISLVNSTDNEGKVALDYINFDTNIDIIKILLDNESRFQLKHFIEIERIDFITHIILNKQLGKKSYDSIRYIACKKNSVELFKSCYSLIKSTSSIYCNSLTSTNLKNIDSCFGVAIIYNSNKIIDYLLEIGDSTIMSPEQYFNCMKKIITNNYPISYFFRVYERKGYFDEIIVDLAFRYENMKLLFDLIQEQSVCKEEITDYLKKIPLSIKKLTKFVMNNNKLDHVKYIEFIVGLGLNKYLQDDYSLCIDSAYNNNNVNTMKHMLNLGLEIKIVPEKICDITKIDMLKTMIPYINNKEYGMMIFKSLKSGKKVWRILIENGATPEMMLETMEGKKLIRENTKRSIYYKGFKKYYIKIQSVIKIQKLVRKWLATVQVNNMRMDPKYLFNTEYGSLRRSKLLKRPDLWDFDVYII